MDVVAVGGDDVASTRGNGNNSFVHSHHNASLVSLWWDDMYHPQYVSSMNCVLFWQCGRTPTVEHIYLEQDNELNLNCMGLLN